MSVAQSPDTPHLSYRINIVSKHNTVKKDVPIHGNVFFLLFFCFSAVGNQVIRQCDKSHAADDIAQ